MASWALVNLTYKLLWRDPEKKKEYKTWREKISSLRKCSKGVEIMRDVKMAEERKMRMKAGDIEDCEEDVNEDDN